MKLLVIKDKKVIDDFVQMNKGTGTTKLYSTRKYCRL